jgi:hypothetical protein
MEINLNFIGIGATKAGTTSFFYYIKDHPQLCLPFEKEIFFFDEINRNENWDAFAQKNFAHYKSGQFVGKMSPRYLRDNKVPERIYALFPDTKLFILMRNPIDRAFSHYRMLYRLGRITEDFDSLVDRQLQPASLQYARTNSVDGEFSLLVQSEYGRILQEYEKYFSGKILFLFTEEMEKDPKSTLKKFYEFLNIDEYYPANVGKKYFVGSDKDRHKWFLPFLRVLWFPRAVWKLLPHEYRKSLMMWYNVKFRVGSKGSSQKMAEATREKLRKFYASDIVLLKKITGADIPWPEFKL